MWSGCLVHRKGRGSALASDEAVDGFLKGDQGVEHPALITRGKGAMAGEGQRSSRQASLARIVRGRTARASVSDGISPYMAR
jgi:hypothetical protein